MNELNNSANPALSIPATSIGAFPNTTGGAFSQSRSRSLSATAGANRVAFAGLYLFTLLLYVRPNELFPSVFGTFPIVKIVAIAAVLAYVSSRLGRGESLTASPIELKLLGVITILGVLFAPLAASPQDSIDVLLDLFIKVGIIFVLMINVIDTRQRLRSIINLVVVCGTIFAVLAIRSYLIGDFTIVEKRYVGVVGLRITGAVGGFFGNPNDLATSLDLLLPLAIALTLLNRGVKRLFFGVCSAVLIAAVIVTFSRGGFLGLIAMSGVLLWKVGRQNRAVTSLAFAIIFGAFLLAMPGGYAGRISSIFNGSEDQTGSTQARRDLLERAASVAAHHPIVGVGMGNFHTYSIHEQVAHNSYLETAAELGIVGFLAYVAFIIAPLRSLKKIEAATSRADTRRQIRANEPEDPNKEIRFMSIALQASLFGYIVCSFFGSIQYQWFLYYPVAYAVALRRIHAAENPESHDDGSTRQTGVLLRRGGFQGAKESALRSR